MLMRFQNAYNRGRLLPAALLLACFAGCQLAAEKQPVRDRASAPAKTAAARTRAIEVVPRYESMRALRYADTLDALDFRKDFVKQVKLSAEDSLAFTGLLQQEPEFTGQYRKRCLPVWDYGLEFQDRGGTPGRLVLFSFRCATIMIRDPGPDRAAALYRDFDGLRDRYYALFKRLLGPNIYMEDELIHRKKEPNGGATPDPESDPDWCYLMGEDC